jgi:hypothetical protein
MKLLAIPKCRDMTELVTNYLEGDLPFSRRLLARLHLALCPPCTRYFDQMRRTIGLLRTASAPTLAVQREDVLFQTIQSGLPPT